MAADDPKPRKVTVLLTDGEWRQLRVAAAEHDTSIQGYVTTTVMRRLQAEARKAAARNAGPPEAS
jgi:hypothetical protein